MRVETTIDISKPPSEVFAFLTDEENLSLWLSHFVRWEHVKGDPGTIGSISRHIYHENGRVVEMEEEITDVNEDQILEAILRNEMMEMTVRNELYPLGTGATDLKVIVEWVPKNYYYKLVLSLFKAKLIKRHREDLNRLKHAVERLGEEEWE